MRNSCENIAQKALAWKMLQQTVYYNGQFATNGSFKKLQRIYKY